MASEIEALGHLVLRRVHAVERFFHTLRFRDYPSDDMRELVEFPSSVCQSITVNTAMSIAQAASPSATPALVDALQRRLKRYGDALEFIYQSLAFVQYGDTPAVPGGFSYYLSEQVAKLSPTAKMALRGDPDFNYMFMPITEIINQSLPSEIKSRLSEPFALFQFPSALQDDALQHCILGHELGHFVDSVHNLVTNSVRSAPPGIYSRLVREVETQSGSLRSAAPMEIQNLYWNQLASWMREVISDLVACHLLGPAFLYAGREFTAFQSDPSKGSDVHPPSDIRHWITESELGFLGWTRLLDEIESPVFPAPALTRTPTRTIAGAAEPMRRHAVCTNALIVLLPSIRREVRKVLKPHLYSVTAYRPIAHQLAESLENMVPIGELRSSGVGRFVDPAAILIAGWLFVAGGYQGWPNKSGAKAWEIRIEKYELLNRLVAKSIEISYVGRHWERASKN